MSDGNLTADKIARDRATITRAEVERLADKFRTQIGGVYEVVAAALERDHAHLER